jgi:hypothetical protein
MHINGISMEFLVRDYRLAAAFWPIGGAVARAPPDILQSG